MTVWVNAERTVLVRQYPGGAMEVATRDHPDAIWGPPIPVEMEDRSWSSPFRRSDGSL